MARKEKKQARRKQASFLEVSARMRPRRRRLWRLALLVLLLGTLGAGGYLGIVHWPQLRDRVLAGERFFALKDIEIVAPFKALSREEILMRSGVRAGRNLLALDLSRIKRDLETIPYVESAAVERVLPHVLRLRVVERTPVARVEVFDPVDGGNTVGRTFYLDAHGAVMPARFNLTDPADPFLGESLPRITGVNPNDLRPGGIVNDAAVLWALTVLPLYRQVGMEQFAGLHSIDVSERGVLTVRLDNGAEATLGPFDMQRQLLRLGFLHVVGQDNGQRLLQVDLSIENNCPSLWVPVAPAPDSPSGSAQRNPASRRPPHDA
ncbi:MAG: FtsQ-type POTRA domain-containing protein [Verrucomicrobiales bacterium]|nr:FtsQ-type POTRA domain-containing protein [Verrucomicrobiales bacterium]